MTWEHNGTEGRKITDTDGDVLYVAPDGDGLTVGAFGEPIVTSDHETGKVYAAVRVSPEDFDILRQYLAQVAAEPYEDCPATVLAEIGPVTREVEVNLAHARTKGHDDLTAARRIIAVKFGTQPEQVKIASIRYSTPQ